MAASDTTRLPAAIAPAPAPATEAPRGGSGSRVQAITQQLQRLWRGLAPRERRLVRLAAAVVGLFALWQLALQPPLRALRDTPAQLARLDAELQRMQQMAVEARGLRDRPTPPTAEATRALQAATAQRLGERARLTLAGDRASVVLQGVSGDALWAWLTEVRSAARVRPVDVKLARRDGASFDGTVVLVLPTAR